MLLLLLTQIKVSGAVCNICVGVPCVFICFVLSTMFSIMQLNLPKKKSCNLNLVNV